MALVRGDRIGESQRLNACPIEAQNFFAALLTYAVTRSGRLRHDLGRRMYGRTDQIVEANIARRLGELTAAGIVVLVGGLYRVPDVRWWVRFDCRPTIPRARRLRVFERDGYQCVRCAALIDLQLDHILPFSRGGGDEETNLQTLCGPCNVEKSIS
jgi:hypothetical protein